MNHTPGPWQQIATKHRTLISSQEGHRVAECESLSEADARLIAAATDLLEIAKGLLALEHQCKTHGLWMLAVNARAAIAKATGENP